MECKLTNYPMGKNLLFVAMQLKRAIEQNQELYFTQNLRHRNEVCAIINNDWYPWLWARNTESKNCSWNLYFDNWIKPDKVSNELEMLAKCCTAIFQPKAEIIVNKKLQTNKKIIGIHVRRGDAKYYLGNSTFKKVVSIETYVTFIKNYPCNEYAIYCASDSIDECLAEINKAAPEYDVYCNLNYRDVPVVPFGFDLEVFMSQNPQYITKTVHSAIVDIYNLSFSDIFIGPIHDSVYSAYTALLLLGQNRGVELFDISNNCSPLIDLNRITQIGIPL